jgi:hypothetical protein
MMLVRCIPARYSHGLFGRGHGVRLGDGAGAASNVDGLGVTVNDDADYACVTGPPFQGCWVDGVAVKFGELPFGSNEDVVVDGDGDVGFVSSLTQWGRWPSAARSEGETMTIHSRCTFQGIGSI